MRELNSSLSGPDPIPDVSRVSSDTPSWHCNPLEWTPQKSTSPVVSPWKRGLSWGGVGGILVLGGLVPTPHKSSLALFSSWREPKKPNRLWHFTRPCIHFWVQLHWVKICKSDLRVPVSPSETTEKNLLLYVKPFKISKSRTSSLNCLFSYTNSPCSFNILGRNPEPHSPNHLPLLVLFFTYTPLRMQHPELYYYLKPQRQLWELSPPSFWKWHFH